MPSTLAAMSTVAVVVGLQQAHAGAAGAVTGSAVPGQWLRGVIDGQQMLVDLVIVGDSNTLYADTPVPEFTLGAGARTNPAGRGGGWEHALAWSLAAECSHDPVIDDESFKRGRMHSTALFPLNSSDFGSTGFLARRVSVTYYATWRDAAAPNLPTPPDGFQPPTAWPYVPVPAEWIVNGQAVPPLSHCTTGEARARSAGDPLALGAYAQVGHGLNSSDPTASATVPIGRCRPLWASSAAPPVAPAEVAANALRISAQSPIDIGAALRARIVHATTPASGSFRAGFYAIGMGGETIPVSVQTVDCQGDPGARTALVPVPEGPERRLTGAEFRYLDAPSSGGLQGEVALFYASMANPSLMSGWSVSTLNHRPGRGLRHLAADLVHAPDETLVTYFGELRARQLANAAANAPGFHPRVLVVVESGINDRFVATPSMRLLADGTHAYDGPASMSAEGMASNLTCILHRIRQVWTMAGWPMEELKFLYVPTHPTAAYGASGDMMPYVIAATQVAETGFPGSLAVLNTGMLTSHAELFAAGHYSSIEAHLRRAGYQLIARRAIRALAGLEDRPACEADLNDDRRVDGADLGQLLAMWGACVTGECRGDIDRDGAVTGADLGLLMAAYGPCPD